MAGRVIAVVGAESTGKTTLAAGLAHALRQQTGRRVAWVGEWLREWCDNQGRTPLEHEQASLLRGQQERIDAAAASHDLVIADTTPLVTAVYSRLIFGDRSLERRGAELHARCAITLLTATDLPWVADGHQRDGAHMQAPVDAALRELLHAAALPFSVIHGQGPARLRQALAAVQPLVAQATATEPAGLFTGLRAAAAGRWLPQCECCSVPALERAARRGPAG